MWKIKNRELREFIAESLGTFVLVSLGCAANANAAVSSVPGNMAQTIAPWAWGMALTAAIFVCGGVSGGHVNPAVTLGMACIGKLAWNKVLYYILAQFLGAFLGAFVVFTAYINAMSYKFDNKEGGLFEVERANSISTIFVTLPNEGITNLACFIDQVVATGFFLLIINAITDKRNMNCPKGLVPIAIGITNLGLVIFSFGYNCGAPINPARDLAPRLFLMFMGCGAKIFYVSGQYFWIPLVACPLGAIIGSFIYKVAIEAHWPVEISSEENSNNSIKFT